MIDNSSYILMKIEDFKKIKSIIDKIDLTISESDYKEHILFLKISYNIYEYIKDTKKQAEYIDKLISIFNLFNKYYVCFVDDNKHINDIMKVYNLFDTFITKLSSLAENTTKSSFISNINNALNYNYYYNELKKLDSTCFEKSAIRKDIIKINKNFLPTYFDQYKLKILNIFHNTGIYMSENLCISFTFMKLIARLLCDTIDTITNSQVKKLFKLFNLQLNNYNLNIVIYFINLICKTNLINLNLLVEKIYSKDEKKNKITNENKISKLEKELDNKEVQFFEYFINMEKLKEKEDQEDDEEKKKVKFINQHSSSFIYIFRDIKKFIKENVGQYVEKMELSPQSKALLLTILVGSLSSIKIKGWRQIGKYYDYKLDKLLKQKRLGRAPNPPNIEIEVNKRMLLTNIGLLTYAFKDNISRGLLDLLDTEVEIDNNKEETPIAFD